MSKYQEDKETVDFSLNKQLKCKPVGEWMFHLKLQISMS